jgi:endonuclease-3
MAVLSKKKIMEAVKLLEDMYPEADCELQFSSVFQLLVAVVLSAQTTDKSVNQVTEGTVRKVSRRGFYRLIDGRRTAADDQTDRNV